MLHRKWSFYFMAKKPDISIAISILKSIDFFKKYVLIKNAVHKDSKYILYIIILSYYILL